MRADAPDYARRLRRAVREGRRPRAPGVGRKRRRALLPTASAGGGDAEDGGKNEEKAEAEGELCHDWGAPLRATVRITDFARDVDGGRWVVRSQAEKNPATEAGCFFKNYGLLPPGVVHQVIPGC